MSRGTGTSAARGSRSFANIGTQTTRLKGPAAPGDHFVARYATNTIEAHEILDDPAGYYVNVNTAAKGAIRGRL